MLVVVMQKFYSVHWHFQSELVIQPQAAQAQAVSFLLLGVGNPGNDNSLK